MDALKRKMEITAVAFFCTVTALIAAYSCATTAAANLAQQTAAAPATEYVTLAYMEVQPEAEQEPELLYDVPMSDELQRYIREQAERQDVPFEIALAVIERESSYQPDAVSDTGDFGLMQINICNHRWLYEELGITDVMDPEQNIEAGLYILGQAFQKYDDPDKALMAYNMGDSGMKAAWSKGQHSSKYSRAVIETAQALKRKEH
jgi:soluble lytic murein transglycosylase-like protein